MVQENICNQARHERVLHGQEMEDHIRVNPGLKLGVLTIVRLGLMNMLIGGSTWTLMAGATTIARICREFSLMLLGIEIVVVGMMVHGGGIEGDDMVIMG